MNQMAFDILNLLLTALIPIAVLVIGKTINERLKKLEYSQWANQRLVEKKLTLYDEIMPRLNNLYCFYMFVGNWKEISPADVISAKRFLDKKVHIYYGILGDQFSRAYDEFMSVAFETYANAGGDARIKSVIASLDGDRKVHAKYGWDNAWETLFPQNPSFDRIQFKNSYDQVVTAFQKTIGIMEPSYN